MCASYVRLGLGVKANHLTRISVPLRCLDLPYNNKIWKSPFYRKRWIVSLLTLPTKKLQEHGTRILIDENFICPKYYTRTHNENIKSGKWGNPTDTKRSGWQFSHAAGPPKNGSITSIPPPPKTKNLKHLTADPTPTKKINVINS